MADCQRDRLLVGRSDGVIYEINETPPGSYTSAILTTIVGGPVASNYFIGDMVVLGDNLFMVCGTLEAELDVFVSLNLKGSLTAFNFLQSTYGQSFRTESIQPGISSHPTAPIVYVVQTGLQSGDGTVNSLEVTSFSLQTADSNVFEQVERRTITVDEILVSGNFDAYVLQRLRIRFSDSVLQMFVPRYVGVRNLNFDIDRSPDDPPNIITDFNEDGLAEIVFNDTMGSYETVLSLNNLFPGYQVTFSYRLQLLNANGTDFSNTTGFYYTTSGAYSAFPQDDAFINVLQNVTLTVNTGENQVLFRLFADWASGTPPTNATARVQIISISINEQNVYQYIPSDLFILPQSRFPRLITFGVKESNVASFEQWQSDNEVLLPGNFYPRFLELTNGNLAICGRNTLNVYSPSASRRKHVNHLPLTIPSFVGTTLNGLQVFPSSISNTNQNNIRISPLSQFAQFNNFSDIDEQVNRNNVFIFAPTRPMLVRIHCTLAYAFQSGSGTDLQAQVIVDSQEGFQFEGSSLSITEPGTGRAVFARTINAILPITESLQIVVQLSGSATIDFIGSFLVNSILQSMSTFSIEFLRYIDNDGST